MPSPETVQWFDGQDSLPEAGRVLLENPELDIVVVRNVGTEALRRVTGRPTQLTELLYAEVPPLTALDDTVTQWWGRQQLGSVYRLHTLQTSQTIDIVKTGIELHIDEPVTNRIRYEGPLTISLRLDTNSTSRLFMAKRGTEAYLNEQGVNYEGIDALYNEIDRRYRARDITGLTKIEQKPNDAVLFANHPYPSLHAVNVAFPGINPYKRSHALVCSYELERIRTS